MTRDELNNAYFKWMCRLVCKDKRYKRLSYRKLLCFLHAVEFTYIIAMDSNRESDGIDLRYRFGYERDYDQSIIATYLDDKPCSVLEMMVALSIRCEEGIMFDPSIGDRTGYWFWTMIKNLGLDAMDDEHFNLDRSEDILSRFLDRQYKRNGEGGLFVIDNCNRDLRSVEIWCQMCWYLNDILENQDN